MTPCLRLRATDEYSVRASSGWTDGVSFGTQYMKSMTQAHGLLRLPCRLQAQFEKRKSDSKRKASKVGALGGTTKEPPDALHM